MPTDWSRLFKALFLGFILTAGGFLLLIFVHEEVGVALAFLTMGPLLLLTSLVMALFYLWMDRAGLSRLPSNWHRLSNERKHAFVQQRIREQNGYRRFWLRVYSMVEKVFNLLPGL